MHNTIRVGEMSVTFLKTRHETEGALDQTPGVMGPEYYLEIAALYRANRHPDLASIGAIMSRYGVVPVTQTENPVTIHPER
jgi:hypothetical protein